MNKPNTDIAKPAHTLMAMQPKLKARAPLMHGAFQISLATATALLMAAPIPSSSAPLDLAGAPLYLSPSVPPNIFFLADDSGSMDWNLVAPEADGQMRLTAGGDTTIYSYLFPQEDSNYATTSGNGRILPSEAAVAGRGGTMPNLAAGAHGVWRGRFSGYNALYYNPNVTYLPWAGVNAAGVAFANITPTAALLNPYYGNTLPSRIYLGSGATSTPSNLVDLTATMSWTANAVPEGDGSPFDLPVTNFYPAMYYTWTDTNSNGVVDATDAHTAVNIVPATTTYTHTAGTRLECGAASTTCTYTQEMQNFANWFSYYRRRILTSKNAIGKVIAPSAARMGLGTLHDNGTVNTQISLMSPSATAGTKRTLLNAVYSNFANNGTPLRTKLDEVGKYYECVTGNIFGLPANTSCPLLSAANGGSCQKNFTVMTTDGYYNDSFAFSAAPLNRDGDGNTGFDGGAYRDAWDNTLADVAMNYFERDLSATLANPVPVVGGDQATHQHMKTYTVAFGVDGNLTVNPPNTTAAFAWPDPNFAGTTTGCTGFTCSTTRIRFATTASSVNNAYNGMYIRNNTTGDFRQITAYDGATRVATVSPSWTDVNDGHNYEEVTSTGVSKVDKNKIDDLRHAAYNGRGKFLSARDPVGVSTALGSALSDIAARESSASAVAVNSNSLTVNTVVYQARFTSGIWSGDLRALTISSGGTIDTNNPLWSVADTVQNPNSVNSLTTSWDTGRRIFTRNGTTGVRFRWDELNASQQAALNDNPATPAVDNDNKGANRLSWLRGDNANEINAGGTGDNFRVRRDAGNLHFKLGDLANSAPIYVGAPTLLPDSVEPTAPHSAFRSSAAVAARANTHMIYVGGNDGMLHGFTTTGTELFAYVPAMLYSDLSKLTDPGYTHRYYVDGSPIAGDAFGSFGNTHCGSAAPCWRTVLVSGLGAGGKGIFALDITDPSVFGLESTVNAGKIALWEVSAAADNDLGYTFAQPTITKVRISATSSKWVAIFGNGYNSVNESAALYVVDIADGTVLQKIIVDAGGGTSGNGLSTPRILDTNSDYIADYAYAGDLKGNIWKFDLTGDQGSWKSAFPATGTPPLPLFKAIDNGPGINAQPITERPAVGAHPVSGYMVYFGTGRFITNGDNTPPANPTHTFYGVWDKGVTSSTVPVERQDLLPQIISAGPTINSRRTRLISNIPIVWRVSGSTACVANGSGQCLGWRVDLTDTGEMSVTNPLLLTTATVDVARLIFTTLIPSAGVCESGGTSWIMELNPVNGGLLPPVIDTNGDGVIDSLDVSVAGIDLNIGIAAEVVVVNDEATGRLEKPISGSSGQVGNLRQQGKTPPPAPSSPSAPGRKSWRQLK